MTIAYAGGEGAAVPTPKRMRRKPKPRDRHLEHQGIRLVVRDDGSFVPADLESRKICRERKLYAGIELLGYLYEPRDPKQWRQAHQVGTFLSDHVEKFHGMNAHEVIKQIQLDAEIACEPTKMLLPKGARETFGVTHMVVLQPKSLSFGFMDEGQWLEIFGRICSYIVKQGWFGIVAANDAEAADAMSRLMVSEKAA